MTTPHRLATLAAMKELAGGDKLFRPSATPRLLKCHGSVLAALRVPALMRRKSGQAAREGTAAHKVAESVLRGERALSEWADRKIDIGDDGGTIICDEEMVDALDLYLEEVQSRRFKGVNLLVEQKLTLALLDPSDPLLAENAGTADCVLIDPGARKLTIVDLKYGKGVMVAGDSAQLKNYALMGSLAYYQEGGWAEIETIVVQPRAAAEAQRVKPVSHDLAALQLDFTGQLITAMERALDTDAPLVAGPHCQFCDAAASCPAARDGAINVARNAFAAVPLFTASSPMPALPTTVLNGVGTYLPHVEADPANVRLPPPHKLDLGELATILERRPLWETWITAVEQRAVALIEGGAVVPGWKLVRRSGNRKWRDEKEVQQAMMDAGLTENQMMETPKLKSPAQMEKVLPKAKRDIVEALVERPLGAPTLVAGNDTRDALPPRLGPIQ